MKVEIVNLHKLPNSGKLKAIFDVSVGGAYTLKGCRLIIGDKGIFVRPPSKKLEDGTYDNHLWSFVLDDKKRITAVSKRFHDAILAAAKVAYAAANDAQAKPTTVVEDLPW